MKRHIVLLPLLLLAALLTSHVRAQGTTYGPDPRVTAGTLENGLSYLLMPLEVVEGEVPRGAAVRLIVDAGLIHEDQANLGAADVAAEAARVRAGAGATAAVADDHAVISLDLEDPSTLAARLTQMAGLASGQAIPGDAMAAGKAAAAERLSRTPVEARVHTLSLRRLTPDSRAVRRPAAGMTDAIRALGTDRVQEFASRWYVPSNMTLIVAAPGTPESLVGIVRGAFGALPTLPRPASPQQAASAWMPPASPVVIEDPDLRGAVVALTAARPSRAGAGIREFRAGIVQQVSLRILNSIVQTRLTKGKVPFTSATTDRLRTPDSLAWTAFHVTGDPAAWRDVVAAAVTEANRIRIHGVDRADVADALIAITAELEAQANAERTAPAASLADTLVQSRGGPSAQQRLDLLLALIRSISPEDVEWEFNKSFDPSATAVLLALPARPGIPSDSEVAEVVRTAWFSQPDPASELVRPWTLLPVLPTPGEIVEISQDPTSGVTSAWLSNGVRVHFRNMPGRQPGMVEIIAALAGSELLEDASTRGFSTALARAWEFPSLPSIPESQLNAMFQATNTRMQVGASGDYFRFSVPTDKSHFNAYMQRLHIILAGAAPSQQAVEFTRDGLIASAQAVGTDVNSTFMSQLADTFFVDGEVRPRPSTQAQAEAINYEAIQAWAQKMAAQPLEVAIVGDITQEDALEAARFYLGSLPSRPRIAADTYASLRGGVLRPGPYRAISRVSGPAGGSTLALRGFFVGSPEDHAEARALDIAAGVLNARLVAEAPRLGLPGGGQVAINNLNEHPGISFVFYVAQGALDEAGVDHMNNMIRELFARFASEGPTPEELAAATEDLATRLEGGVDYAGSWADYLSAASYRARPVDGLIQNPLIARAMTAEQVREVFARYFGRENNVIELAVLPAPPDELLQYMDAPPPPPPTPELEGDPANEPQPAGPPTPPGGTPPGR